MRTPRPRPDRRRTASRTTSAEAAVLEHGHRDDDQRRGPAGDEARHVDRLELPDEFVETSFQRVAIERKRLGDQVGAARQEARGVTIVTGPVRTGRRQEDRMRECRRQERPCQGERRAVRLDRHPHARRRYGTHGRRGTIDTIGRRIADRSGLSG